MNTFKPKGVGSLGSADSSFDFKAHEDNPFQDVPTTPAQNPVAIPRGPGQTTNQDLAKLPKEYNLNPILQKFSDSLGGDIAAKLSKDPNMQAKLFDFDNGIKSNAGIFRKGQDGLKEIGTDHDGQPLFSAPEMLDPKSSNLFNAGSSQLEAAGMALDSVGGFNEAEAKRFVGGAKKSSDPRILGTLHGQITAGDTKGAVNAILGNIGGKSLDAFGKGEASPKDLSHAFAATSLVDNWQSMNNTQRSLALSALHTSSFKYDDGKALGAKVLVEANSKDGPELTTGDALAFAGSGVNVPTLLKNWDQIDAIQRITFGQGTSSQMVATGQRMGFLGDSSTGDAAIKADVLKMAKLGFSAAPSAGLGAITGPADNIPEGYQVVGGGKNPNTVVAVPQGAAFTTALANGSSSVVSLGDNKNLHPASPGAKEVYLKWGEPRTAKNGVVGGTQFSAGLSKSGVLDDPYTMGAVVATSLHGNIVQQKGTVRESIDYEDAVSKLGTNSNVQQKDVNLNQVRKSDETVNTILKTGQSATNLMAKHLGSTDAAQAAPYVNAAAAGKKLYDVMNDPNATDKQKTEAVANASQSGTGVAAALGNQTAAGALPGVTGAMMAYNASKIVGSNMSDKEKAVALRRTAEDTAASYYTFGLSNLAQFGDQKLLGGKVAETRTKIDKLNPNSVVSDKLTTAALSKVDSLSGGKSKAQGGRDSVRKNIGLMDEEYKVTLAASNTKADIGMDGHGGKHEFTNPDKSVDGKRSLSAYDVDYTNDLDYSSNMMSSALVRLISGGKGKEVDQVAGQLGNAAIKEIGFGQEMTAENFTTAQTNARGFFAQKGIKTKEDAYALANQAVAEGRMTEMDAVTVHQGINMAFDKNGYDTAGKLMAGRWKGLDVAAQIPKAPGPNLNIVAAPSTPTSVPSFAKTDPANMEKPADPLANPEDTINSILAGKPVFQFDESNYGGAKTAGTFQSALNGYIDPSTVEGGNYTPEQIAKLKEYGVEF